MQGFIHNFAVYQKAHVVGDTTLADGGCASGCWTVDYDKYLDGANATQNCPASCNDNNGCWRDEELCDAYEAGTVCDSSHTFCYLCPDADCKKCDAEGVCASSMCRGTISETDGADDCQCTTAHYAPDRNHHCKRCYALCEVCTDVSNYAGCSGCTNGHVTISGVDGWKYCVKKCPSGYEATADTPPKCNLTASSTHIVSYDFNIPKVAFANDGDGGADFDLAGTTNVVSVTGSC
ncbi:MAG: hypothetical protein V2I33_25875 [Kangiellaceae bacterium]|nr:hypothetical protein [Kangiellaceae bacterium]